eukprot:GFYU01001266.1.p1 GENE.GFYU01001266.1~~GFYU01001266.1.p1  ORF type:complete len:746 (+),score=192.26 GFYU01001266.1:248-2485(+)
MRATDPCRTLIEEHVARLMSDSTSQTEKIASACGLQYAVGHKDATTIADLADCGGIDALVQMVREGTSDAKTAALAVIAQASIDREKLVDEDDADSMFQLMTAIQSSTAFARCGGIECLVRVLASPEESTMAKAYAMVSLRNVLDEHNATLWSACGGIAVIGDLLKEYLSRAEEVSHSRSPSPLSDRSEDDIINVRQRPRSLREGLGSNVEDVGMSHLAINADERLGRASPGQSPSPQPPHRGHQQQTASTLGSLSNEEREIFSHGVQVIKVGVRHHPHNMLELSSSMTPALQSLVGTLRYPGASVHMSSCDAYRSESQSHQSRSMHVPVAVGQQGVRVIREADDSSSPAINLTAKIAAADALARCASPGNVMGRTMLKRCGLIEIAIQEVVAWYQLLVHMSQCAGCRTRTGNDNVVQMAGDANNAHAASTPTPTASPTQTPTQTPTARGVCGEVNAGDVVTYLRRLCRLLERYSDEEHSHDLLRCGLLEALLPIAQAGDAEATMLLLTVAQEGTEYYQPLQVFASHQMIQVASDNLISILRAAPMTETIEWNTNSGDWREYEWGSHDVRALMQMILNISRYSVHTRAALISTGLPKYLLGLCSDVQRSGRNDLQIQTLALSILHNLCHIPKDSQVWRSYVTHMQQCGCNEVLTTYTAHLNRQYTLTFSVDRERQWYGHQSLAAVDANGNPVSVSERIPRGSLMSPESMVTSVDPVEMRVTGTERQQELMRHASAIASTLMTQFA